MQATQRTSKNSKPLAGKHATRPARNRCQSRENLSPVSSAGNHATGVKGGKTTRWGQTTPQMGHEMSRFLVNF